MCKGADFKGVDMSLLNQFAHPHHINKKSLLVKTRWLLYFDQKLPVIIFRKSHP
jgi:hypothetical protein